MKRKFFIVFLLAVIGVSVLKFTCSGTGGDWQLILVNSEHSIPYGYAPELTELSNGVRIDERIYPDLQRMFNDMRNAGIFPVVSEGYRTREEQKEMMSDKIESFISEGYSRREAKNLAREWVAVPGKSEHEIGLALDINADQSRSADAEVYEWLAENAHTYGFILRYPSGREDVTGIAYEPWHYRYVGTEAAEEIHGQNVTLEEYLS